MIGICRYPTPCRKDVLAYAIEFQLNRPTLKLFCFATAPVIWTSLLTILQRRGLKKKQTVIDRRDQQPILNGGEKSCVFADLFYKEQEGKVLSEDDAKHNDDQFPEVAAQEPTQKQQPLEQERFIALVNDHQSCRNKKRGTRKRRNILMGWLCSKVIKVFDISKGLLYFYSRQVVSLQ